MPPRLFKNRTLAVGFAFAIISAILLQTVAYFMPVYFQAILGTSPLGAGIDFLPYTAAIVSFGIVAGIVMSKTGLYKPLHWAGFALNAIGAGLLSLLSHGSSKAAWACFQIIAAAGTGIILTAMLPAILAALPESDVAVATGVFSFVRSFGYTWGVTVSSIVFNDQFNRYSGSISDAGVRDQLVDGAAYGLASGDFVKQLLSAIKNEVIAVYVVALQRVWQITIAFSCLGFFLVFVEKHVELRKELNTEYGLEEKQASPNHAADSEGGVDHIKTALAEREPNFIGVKDTHPDEK